MIGLSFRRFLCLRQSDGAQIGAGRTPAISKHSLDFALQKDEIRIKLSPSAAA
jgi:hypothetical protein